MRKRLIFIIVIGLSLFLMLIIYNLWNSDKQQPQQTSVTPPFSLDGANLQDVAWFSDRKITPAHIVSIPAIHAATATIADQDQRIQQAPISSNQIHIEPGEIHYPHLTGNAASLNRPPHQQSDTANSQTEKTLFLRNAEQGIVGSLSSKIQNPQSIYEIKTGTIIPAILISGINSDLPGNILAQVRENIYDSISGRYLLIPQGAKLQGIYDAQISYGQKRVLIAWQRLILPNGQTLQLFGMPGTDVNGYAGFQDIVNNHYTRLFGSALLMSMVSAGLQLSQPQPSNSATNQPSVNQILAQNTGISLSQTTDQLLRKNLNTQPTLEIRPGYLFNVSVTKDIVFARPYS